VRIGMIIAIFTGGLANLQAAGLILGLDEFELVAANLGDVIAGGILFLCLTSFGWPVLKRLFATNSMLEGPTASLPSLDSHAKALQKTAPSKLDYVKALFLAVGCVAIAAGLSYFLPEEFIELSILSIGALFAISVGHWLERGEPDGESIAVAGQNLGEYLMLVFCVLIGWSANWTSVGTEALVWAGQMGLFLIIQVLVSLVLAKALRVAPALYLMALVGCIYSPAFVPPIATTTRRYDLVPTGIFIGLIGLALGTLVGVLFARGFA